LQLTPLSTHTGHLEKKMKKRVQSFSDTVYICHGYRKVSASFFFLFCQAAYLGEHPCIYSLVFICYWTIAPAQGFFLRFYVSDFGTVLYCNIKRNVILFNIQTVMLPHFFVRRLNNLLRCAVRWKVLTVVFLLLLL
jgi:hypothetical protein